MQCFLCNLDKSETVTLWNGEEYCEECTGRVHKGLYAYAQQNETLSSNYQQFSNRRTVWKFFNYETIVVLCIIGFIGILNVPNFLKAEDVHDLVGKLIGLILLGALLFILSLMCRLVGEFFRTPTSEVIALHPYMDIANGKITLSSQRASLLFMHSQNIVLSLSVVKLQVLPLSYDKFFPPFADGNDERYCLLDFSECTEEAYQGIKSIEGSVHGYPDERVWQENPYLCFTACPFENEILKAFFDLLGRVRP